MKIYEEQMPNLSVNQKQDWLKKEILYGRICVNNTKKERTGRLIHPANILLDLMVNSGCKQVII